MCSHWNKEEHSVHQRMNKLLFSSISYHRSSLNEKHKFWYFKRKRKTEIQIIFRHKVSTDTDNSFNKSFKHQSTKLELL